MKFTYFLWVLVVNLLFSASVFSQQSLSAADPTLQADIDRGVDLMSRGEFVQADTYFKEALSKVSIVPADLCFYFGKNSYHLKKYKQSIDWLNKYIELKGTTGSYFNQAVEYLEMAETDLQLKRARQQQASKPAEKESKQKSSSNSIDCEKHPYVTCPICKGTDVLVERGSLGASVYKNCPYSDEHGRMTCEDYHLYLGGQLFTEK